MTEEEPKMAQYGAQGTFQLKSDHLNAALVFWDHLVLNKMVKLDFCREKLKTTTFKIRSICFENLPKIAIFG